MEQTVFHEEEQYSSNRGLNEAPARSKKLGLTDRLMKVTGISNRKVAEAILLGVALLSLGATVIFVTREEPPANYPYQPLIPMTQ